MVPLAVGEAEQALLENRVLAVPQRQREAKALLVIGNTRDAVLAPAVGARAGVIVGEEIPGVAILAVILADRAPLALAEIGAPFPPRNARLAGIGQTVLFRGIGDWLLVHGCSFSRWPPRQASRGFGHPGHNRRVIEGGIVSDLNIDIRPAIPRHFSPAVDAWRRSPRSLAWLVKVTPGLRGCYRFSIATRVMSSICGPSPVNWASSSCIRVSTASAPKGAAMRKASHIRSMPNSSSCASTASFMPSV